jgi:tetratricopeptide (TPR) repeat protein
MAEIVASHYLTALELDPEADDASEIEARARATLVKAGERAAALAASGSAQRYFEQALELTSGTLERAELHERAGVMAFRGRRIEESREHLLRAEAGFEELGLAQHAARVLARLAIEITWNHESDIERAITDMERAFAVLVEGERSAELATLAAQLARPLYFSGRVDEATARNELALDIGEALLLPDVISHGLNTKALILNARGRHQEAELLLRHALELALAGDIWEAASRAYSNLLFLVGPVGDRWREALELSRSGVAHARRVGDENGRLWLEGWVAGILGALGEWDEAIALGELAMGESSLAAEPGFLGNLVFLYVERGERERVDELMAVVTAATDLNEIQARVTLRSLEALVHLRDGRPLDALAPAEEGWATRAQVGMHQALESLQIALECAFELGDREKVDRLLGDLEALPPGEATPAVRALGARFSARRAALDGDDTSADAGFVAAADIFREIEVPFDLAVVMFEHGQWLAGVGRRDEAQQLLDQVRGIFERLRAAPWLERLNAVELEPEPAAAG